MYMVGTLFLNYLWTKTMKLCLHVRLIGKLAEPFTLPLPTARTKCVCVCGCARVIDPLRLAQV